MGSIIQPSYTIPLPDGAKIRNGVATWTAKGKKKTGSLSGPDRVLCKSEIWVVKFIDENGQPKKISAKTKSREAARRRLTNLENEVSQIRAGVMSREEINRSKVASVPLSAHLDAYRLNLVASGDVATTIKNNMRLLRMLLEECEIGSLGEISRETVVKWIAAERQRTDEPIVERADGKKRKKKIRSARTINSYLIAANSFCNWAVDTGRLTVNPLRKIKKLNEEVDRKKDRRSLSEDELRQLFKAVHERGCRREGQAEEHELIYRLLVGTGLRSTELSLATPSQFDFERNRFTVKAVATKNKKPDILPIRPELAAKLKEWIERHEIGSSDRIFTYDKNSIRRSFYADLAAAGSERIGADGRSIDVHSLRRTFGTMLARAGVPLTTTQKLMRHSTPELTAKLYIDVEPIDMLLAVEKLPEL